MRSLPAIQVSREMPVGRSLQLEPIQRRAEDRGFSGPLCRSCGSDAERRIGRDWLCAVHAELSDQRSGRCSTCAQLLPLESEQADEVLTRLGLDALHLTATERRLVLALASGERVSVARLMDRVWSQHYGEPFVGDQRHLLRVHGSRLRSKLEPHGWTLLNHKTEQTYQLVRLDGAGDDALQAALARRQAMRVAIPDLIAARLRLVDGGHVLWTGHVHGGQGQPMLYAAGTHIAVRRWRWQERHGPLPAESIVLGACRQPRCVEHLVVKRRGGR